MNLDKDNNFMLLLHQVGAGDKTGYYDKQELVFRMPQ